MVTVRLYVEGSGKGKKRKRDARRGFREFFKKAKLTGHRLMIIPSGSRRRAYDDFCLALDQTGDACALLLVDSEDPVSDRDDPWEHLRKRREDGWTRPAKASDGQCHLMVQFMESWFLADKTALAEYFGRGFNERALPKRKEIEAIPKDDVMRGLREATRRTKKRNYSKGSHSFDLLAKIDPNLVRRASKFADRLLTTLAHPERVC